MKAIYFILLIVTTACPAQDVLPDSCKYAWSMESYSAFVRSMQPHLDKMAQYQVVGLGEGTHGTSEFQTIRAFITRYLAEEKGFNVVVLENSYGPTAELNDYLQTGRGNLQALMKKDLFGLWQNKEMRSMLEWMREQKIHIMGMDIALIAANGAMLKQAKDPKVDTLVACCNYMDEAWRANNSAKHYPWKDIVQNSVKGYETVIALKDKIPDSLQTALYNCKLAFYSFYGPMKEKKKASRDQAMALMVKRAAETIPNAKIIVWAHSAHLAKKSIFDGGGDVTGAYLDSLFPGNYYVAGTGTAGGTVSVTKDHFIVNTSKFKKTNLPMAPDGSWESGMTGDHVYFDLTKIKNILPKKTSRFTGYRAPGLKDFYKVQLNALFDGFFFIRKTRGTTVLQ